MEQAHRFALHATKHSEDARELAAKFAQAGERIVVAAGGDGTLNAVMSGLVNSDTALGILPVGTMNVFARELGIPTRNLMDSVGILEAAHIREIDVFSANGAPFLQMAGIGFDAKVIEETSWKAKKRFGPLAYLLAAVKVLGDTPPRLQVYFEDGRTEDGVAVLVGNGTLYGGQFRLFRKANNQDSLLDVIVLKAAGYPFLLDSLRGLARGGLDLSASASSFQSSTFSVRAESTLPVEIDGELLGRFSEVHFAANYRRLRVVAPAPTEKVAFSCK